MSQNVVEQSTGFDHGLKPSGLSTYFTQTQQILYNSNESRGGKQFDLDEPLGLLIVFLHLSHSHENGCDDCI